MFGSIGASSSRSSSQSSSLDYSANTSGSFSDSLAQSLSRSGGSSTSRIAFEDLFQQLYGSATGAAGRAAEMSPLLSGQAAQLFTGGSQFLESLGGGAGENYLESRLGPNPLLDEQIGQLGSDVGRFFREELNPAVTGSSVAAGQLGGGRQGVAQGRAIDSAGRQFQRGATELRAADMASRDQAASQLMAGRTQAAGTGLSSLQGLFDLAAGGAGAEMMPYQALASIMGGPTSLTDSEQFAEATSESVARAISEAMGFSYGTSQSTSKSKSKSMNVGM